MPNVGSIISSHNKKIIENKIDEIQPCNCRNKEACPLVGTEVSCRTDNVIYKAEIKTENETKNYIGLTSAELKKKDCKPPDRFYI